MREKKSIKRAIALILAAVLTFTTFSSDITAVAAENVPATKNTVSVETKDGIGLAKSAVLNSDGTVDVTFKVDGNTAVQYQNQTAKTDIILVLDTSPSMVHESWDGYYDDKNSKLSKAKTAAKAFAQTVFADKSVNNENVRIGVVTFWGSSKKIANLTNKSNAQDLYNKIDGIKYGTEGGTNIQAGIREASHLFGEGNDNKKIIVLMSDGAANYAYQSNPAQGPTSYKFNSENRNYTIHSFNSTETYEYVDLKETEVYKDGGKYYFDREWHGSIIFGHYSYSNQLPSQYNSYVYDAWDGYYVYSATLSDGSVKYINCSDVEPENYSYYCKYDKVYGFAIKEAAVMEAQTLKNVGAKFYTVKYDVDKNDDNADDAEFALSNIASIDGKTNRILCYDSPEDSIKNIFESIAEQVGEDIAAAKGTQLVDTLPSYMKFKEDALTSDSIARTDVKFGTDANDPDKQTMTIDLSDAKKYDLKSDKSYEITVKCTLDIADMIAVYASEHNTTVDAVRKQMSESKISFNLNDNAVLTYKDALGNDVTEDSIKATGNISTTNVPYTTITTYPYDVEYVVDGVLQDTVDTFYGFDKEKITYSDALLNKDITDEYTTDKYNYEVDKTEFTVSPSKRDTFTVNITSKEVEVKFVSQTPDGEVEVDKQTVKVGSNATDPFTNADVKARFEGLYKDYMVSVSDNNVKYNYSFSGWTNGGNNASLGNITSAGTFVASYGAQVKKFSVTFDTSAANGATWANEVASVQNIEYGNTVSEPSNAINSNNYPEDVESISVKWLLNGSEYDFTQGITDNITLVADYTINYKQVTVNFLNWNDTVYATETFRYGTTIPNYSEKQLADNVTDASILKHLGTWNTKKDGSGDGIFTDTVVKSDLVLYPVYTSIRNSYTVTWKYRNPLTSEWVQEPVWDVKYQAAVSKPDAVAARTFVFEGLEYKFDGWTLEAGVKETVNLTDASVTSCTSDITFVASYSTEAVDYEFTFIYKDASGNEESDTVPAHWGETLVPNAPVSYEITNDDGEVIENGTLTGWEGDAFAPMTSEGGSATAQYNSKTHYFITFVNPVSGTRVTQNVVEGDMPTDPGFTAESVNGIVKKIATGWDSEITEADENKTYTAEYDTYYYCETVHTIGGVEAYGRYNAEWVLSGQTYTASDNITSYPYEDGTKKYDRADENANLSITAGENSYLVTIALVERETGTINFIDHKGNKISSTGYVGDELSIEVPTVTADTNTFTAIYSVDAWFDAAENGNKVSVDGITYTSGETNLYAVQTETLRKFVLNFYDEDGNLIADKTISNLTSKDAIEAAKNAAVAPTKESTKEDDFEGSWGAIYLVDAEGLTATTLDGWGAVCVNDTNEEIVFGTKAGFTSVAHKYEVKFVVTRDGHDNVIETQKVHYKQSATDPSLRKAMLIGFVLPRGKQFTGWDKDFSSIEDDVTIYAELDDKHSLIYQNYDGRELKRDTYPKYGQKSYDVTVLGSTEVGARKTFEKYSYVFEGWMLGEELKQAEDVVSVANGDVVLKAKFEENVPVKFFLRLPWYGKPLEIMGHDSSHYTTGISATADNFNYDMYYAGQLWFHGNYTNRFVNWVVNPETAPAYEDFTVLASRVPNLAGKNITPTIDWYVAKIQDDGVHVDGYPSYTHDTVTLEAEYTGENLVDALYEQLLEKADGVYVSHDAFIEAFGEEVRNSTNVSVTLVGQFTTGNKPVVEDVKAPDEQGEASHTFDVKLPIELNVTARPATVTIDNKSKYTDQADPAFTYSVSNLVDGDELVVTLAREAGTAVGTYTIDATSISGNELGNYDVTVNKGVLTISTRPATGGGEEPGTTTPPAEEPTPGGGEGGGQITPPLNPPAAAETPTEVAEVQELPTLTLTENEVPMAAAPAEGKQEINIDDEDVPMAVASQCYMHWIILAIALVYAIYATLRAVQNKKELEDNEEFAKNNN